MKTILKYILTLTALVLSTMVLAQPCNYTITHNETAASCFESADGSSQLIIFGSPNSLYYVWDDSNGQTSDIATGLTAGTYNITITDSIVGCSDTTSITITEPSEIVLNESMIPASCVGGDGEISVNPSGGTGNYTYSWAKDTVISTTSLITSLDTGLYHITVTDTSNCSIDTSFYLYMDTIEYIIYTKIDPTCQVPKGSIQIDSIIGGFEGYKSALGDFDFQNVTGYYDLPASVYFIQIQDARGCIYTDTTELPIPEGIQVEFVAEDVPCDQWGSIEILEPTTGVPPYIYTLDSVFAQTSSVFNMLQPKTYTISIEDSEGCQTNYAVSVPNACKPIPTPVDRFSPNDDGINDTWYIGGLSAHPHAKVYVYNRWGQRVHFEQGGRQAPWDGTSLGINVPVATYYYVIKYDQKGVNDAQITGHVTIIR